MNPAASPFDLSGKAFVVTGGASGIGDGMVAGLVQAGGRVAVWDLPGPRLTQADRRLRSENQGLGIACDVRDAEQVGAALRATELELGPLQGCFANAGVGGARARLADSDPDAWRAVLDVNVEGAMLTLRAAARALIAGGLGGTLVVTSSLAARSGAAGSAAYGASKGAVQSLALALAVELAPHNIRVHAVLPGWIETEMTVAALGSPALAAKVLPRVPLRRWGRPADFSGLAVYLMSEASSYQTGGLFVVDGGYSVF